MIGGPDSSSDARRSGDEEREAENVSLVGKNLDWHLRRRFLGIDMEVAEPLLGFSDSEFRESETGVVVMTAEG